MILKLLSARVKVKMDIQGRIDLLINYIRGSRRRLVLNVLLVFIITLVIFFLGSYFFLFNDYEGIIKEYYHSLMMNISSFQHILVKNDSYRDDLKNIAVSISSKRGVIEVWCTDKFGKLIFHTDNSVFEEYKSRRLPSDYYENINHVWKFQNGYPEIKVVRLEKPFFHRYSIPIYMSGKGDYDFILGMDVKRFIFLPEKGLYILLLTVGYIVFAFLLLFIPSFLWVRNRFNNIISRARVVMGSIQLDMEQAGAATQKEAGIGEGEALLERIEESKKETVKEPEVVIEPAALEEEKSEKEIPVEENMAGNPLLLLMEQKQKLFRKQEVELPFLQAGSFIYHSPESQGNYFYYNRSNGYHFFTVFAYPGAEPGQALDQLTQITESLDENAEESVQTRNILIGLNNYCLDNNLTLNASALMINEEEKRVEYTSCGRMPSIYLKHKEEVVKDLTMDIPVLGNLSEIEFAEAFTYAEIDFVAGDIFAILSNNTDEILVEEESFYELIKRTLLLRRDSTVGEIGSEIHKIFEPFRRKKRNLPETGFAVFKFI